VPNGSTLSPESPAADADNTKSIGATPLAGDSWPAGTNGQVESTVSGASLPHLPLIFEPNESAASPRAPEKSTELLEMVELSESTLVKERQRMARLTVASGLETRTRVTVFQLRRTLTANLKRVHLV